MENSKKEMFEKLELVYSFADKIINEENGNCLECGKCCNFNTNGMRLYIFTLERMYLEEKYGQMSLVNGNCKALVDNKCSIHNFRPLGCRTQFCDKTFDTLYEQCAKKIHEIEKEHGIQYFYGNAFLPPEI